MSLWQQFTSNYVGICVLERQMLDLVEALVIRSWGCVENLRISAAAAGENIFLLIQASGFLKLG